MPFRKEKVALLLSIALLSTSSYTFANSTAVENHEQSIDNHLLTLNNDTNACELVVKTDNSKTHLSLSLSTPCYWVTKPDSTDLQFHSYPAQAIDHVFLIAGTALDWDDEKKNITNCPLILIVANTFKA